MSLLSCILAALASPTFLLTSLLIVASPGTGAVLTIVAVAAAMAVAAFAVRRRGPAAGLRRIVLPESPAQ